MSNFTDLFPQASGSGGGGGTEILDVEEFTSSGTFSPSSAGLSVGDNIIILCVAGGGSGSRKFGTSADCVFGAGGGQVKYKTFTLTSTSNIAVTVGAGAARGAHGADGLVGGNSSFGSIVSCTGGTKGIAMPTTSFSYPLMPIVKGPHGGAHACNFSGSIVSTNAGEGIDGYGGGGAALTDDKAYAVGTSGDTVSAPGSGGQTANTGSKVGSDGIIKIYYKG